jgi:hypothetical protein
MKALINLSAVILISSILTACIGETKTTTTVAATTTPTTTTTPATTVDTGVTLNLKSSIYQAFRSYSGLPSGTLTLTTDTEGTKVYGKYSVTTSGQTVSTGTVSGSTSKLTLVSSELALESPDKACKEKLSTCCKENLSIYPLSTTSDSSKVLIYGEDCNGQAIIVTERIKKVTGLSLSSVLVKSSIYVQNNVDMTLSVKSADNVTFLGTLSFFNNNEEFSKLAETPGEPTATAKATVVGFSTYSSSDTVRPVNQGGTDVRFKVTNFIGHLFSPVDVLTFPDYDPKKKAPHTYIRFKSAPVVATGGYNIDKFNVYITDTYPLTQSILLGNHPKDWLQAITPYIPL